MLKHPLYFSRVSSELQNNLDSDLDSNIGNLKHIHINSFRSTMKDQVVGHVRVQDERGMNMNV
jgi:hypothetical protein